MKKTHPHRFVSEKLREGEVIDIDLHRNNGEFPYRVLWSGTNMDGHWAERSLRLVRRPQ